MEPVIACMATFPPRYEMAKRTARDLAKQVDELHLYVNNRVTDDLSWLHHIPPNINPIIGSKTVGRLGDVGKFFPLQYIPRKAHVLLVDDDINYPANYAERMVRKIHLYDKSYVVGVHGCNLPNENVSSYYRNGQLKKVHFHKSLNHDRPVHLLGTGTAAFYKQRVGIKLDYFETQNMADIWLARYCQDKNIGMMMVSRDRTWLTANKTPDGGIYRKYKDRDTVQTFLVNEYEWSLNAHTKKLS